MPNTPYRCNNDEIGQLIKAEVQSHGNPDTQETGTSEKPLQICCRSWWHVLSGAALRVLEFEAFNSGHPTPSKRAHDIWNAKEGTANQEHVLATLWRCTWYLRNKEGGLDLRKRSWDK